MAQSWGASSEYARKAIEALKAVQGITPYKGPTPQIKDDGSTDLLGGDQVVEVDGDKNIKVYIFDQGKTYNIVISAATLLRIIAKRAGMMQDAIQVGEGDGKNVDEIIIATEDELLGR